MKIIAACNLTSLSVVRVLKKKGGKSYSGNLKILICESFDDFIRKKIPEMHRDNAYNQASIENYIRMESGVFLFYRTISPFQS